jgi:hypothetical protein
MTKLANDNVARLFTVPASEWTAISKRVGLARLMENISAEATKTLPSYPRLLVASKEWAAATFPGIVDHSSSVAEYASIAIATFSALRNRINALPAGTTRVPDDLAASVRSALLLLRDATAVQSERSAELGKAIDSFRIVNDAVDTDIMRLSISSWSSVSAQTRAVATAISHVEGTWVALTVDLHALIANAVDVTMPFLVGLQLDVAIASWQRIQIESTAFGSMASGQWIYLNGRPA